MTETENDDDLVYINSDDFEGLINVVNLMRELMSAGDEHISYSWQEACAYHYAINHTIQKSQATKRILKNRLRVTYEQPEWDKSDQILVFHINQPFQEFVYWSGLVFSLESDKYGDLFRVTIALGGTNARVYIESRECEEYINVYINDIGKQLYETVENASASIIHQLGIPKDWVVSNGAS